MCDDLKERLRATWLFSGETEDQRLERHWGDMESAADRIEELEAENERLLAKVRARIGKASARRQRIRALEAENERLRERLTAMIRAHETGRFEEAQVAYEAAMRVEDLE